MTIREFDEEKYKQLPEPAFLRRNIRHRRRQATGKSSKTIGEHRHEDELQRLRVPADRRAVQEDVQPAGETHRPARGLGEHLPALHRVLCAHPVHSEPEEERACKDCGRIIYIYVRARGTSWPVRETIKNICEKREKREEPLIQALDAFCVFL